VAEASAEVTTAPIVDRRDSRRRLKEEKVR
jgi:hypothetical protein